MNALDMGPSRPGVICATGGFMRLPPWGQRPICRISRASSGMMWPCGGGYCLDEEPQPATHGGLSRPVTPDRRKAGQPASGVLARRA